MPPNEKISDLGAAAPLVLTDHVLIARGAAAPNLKATIQAVLALSGGVGGGGTINKIPLWTSPGVLGNSALSQVGSNISVAGNLISAGTNLGITGTVVGTNVNLICTNNDTTDPASNARVVIDTQIGGGDPFISLFARGAQEYLLGVDRSDSAKLVGSVGAVLGTGNWLEVTTARGITLDAASGQTVALAVNSVEELQVSSTVVTIPTNDFEVTDGKLRIGNFAAGFGSRDDLVISRDQADVGLSILSATDGKTGIFFGDDVDNVAAGITYDTGAGRMLIAINGNQLAVRIKADLTLQAEHDMIVLGGLTLPTGDAEITGGMLGIGNPPTLPLDVNAKAGITSIGGYAIKLTNGMGSSTVKGQLVVASTSADDAFTQAAVDSVKVIGVVLEGGVSIAGQAWVVISGKAEVLMDGDGCTHGDRIGTGGTAGRGAALTSPSNTEHFQEIGHSFQSVGGATLARVDLHFN